MAEIDAMATFIVQTTMNHKGIWIAATVTRLLPGTAVQRAS